MAENLPLRRGLPAMHPGAFLSEIVLPALKASGTPKQQVAVLMDVPRTSFYEFLAGTRPLTAELALKLGKLCGNGPDIWMNLQKDFDLERARASLGETLEAIPTLKVA